MAFKNENEISAICTEIDHLQHKTVTQLHQKYREVFGEPSRSNHKQFLVRRIAWRLQALAEGDLSERARERALRLACDADLRLRAPQSVKTRRLVNPRRDPRLPQPGTTLSRVFRERTITVKVLETGFQYEDRVYRSLSAVARCVSGTQWNGFSFFQLPHGED